MKRIVLNNTKEHIFDLSNSSDLSFVLDCKDFNDDVVISTGKNRELDILVSNIKENTNLTFEVGDGTKLHLSSLLKNDVKSFKITANVGQNSVFESYIADFISNRCKAEIMVNLNGENARCDWHLASLSKGTDNKEFNVSSFHNSPNTFSQLDNYGVVRDDGKLLFSGICQINNGSHASKAHQNAKIMVFDSLSNGIAKPILKIDENDIEASHAAVVGKINDEHIFYLTSRGLSEEEAKRIITLGYLKPISNGFDDEDIKEEIEKMIEGNM